MEYTKGPLAYTTEDGDRYLRDSKGNALMCDMTYYPWIDAKEGDWHLWAAAPELLETIKQMRSYINSFAEDGVRPDEWIMREWVGKCDRSIFKAEGRT